MSKLPVVNALNVYTAVHLIRIGRLCYGRLSDQYDETGLSMKGNPFFQSAKEVIPAGFQILAGRPPKML